MPCPAPAAAPAPRPSEVTLRIDYAGAEAMMAGLERTGKVADEHVDFNLWKARSEGEGTRALLTYIRENEQAVLEP